MAEAKQKEANPFEIRVEVLGTSVKINVRDFGKGLDLGQLELIENEFGVDVHEIQGMNPQNLSAKRLAAWAFGLLLPKIPKIKPSDVRALSVETINEWWSLVADQIDEVLDERADTEEDDVPLDSQEPTSTTPGSAESDEPTSLPTGESAEIPESSGDPGWDGTSTSDPQTSGT